MFSAISGRPGRGVDGQRGAGGEEDVGFRGGELRAHQVLGHEVLAERDGRRLEHPAALEARGVLLTGAHAVEGLLHRAVPAAVEALRAVDGAVDLDDPVG